MSESEEIKGPEHVWVAMCGDELRGKLWLRTRDAWAVHHGWIELVRGSEVPF